MECICYCPFADFSKNSFLANTFEFTGVLADTYSFIKSSNIDVLFCIKTIFHFEYFKRSIGGLIITILIFLNTICVIIYFCKSKNDLKIYIFNILNSYLQSLNQSIKNEPPKK